MISQDTDGLSNRGNVSVDAVFEVASLIYAEIDGETVHEGEVLENRIPAFVTGAPITLSALISNKGNVHESAVVLIEAKNVFSGEVIAPASDPNEYYTELIMPNTTRVVERSISEGLPALGIVEVKQTILYNGVFSSEMRQVVICPIWFMFLVGFVVAAAIGIIVRAVIKHGKKKKRYAV